MTNDISIRKAVENYFGEEFPEVKSYTESEFEEIIGVNPNTQAKWVDLEDTYKIAEYFDEDHLNVVEAIIIEAGLLIKQ